jgi:hypothetical protein
MAALEQWEQVNVSPNFPAVSSVLLEMYEASTGKRLDGVISMDPIALAHLIRATGPLSADGMEVAIRPHNAARVLLHDSYFAFAPDQRARDAYLVGLVDDFWRRLSGGSLDVDALVRGAVRSARGRHLAIYSREGREQQALVNLGLDGGFSRYGPNVQLVFNNNAAANKVDYYLRRSIHTEVRLSEIGDASISTRVILRNYAPKGPPSYFLGPGIKGDPAGMNRMLLGFLLPQGSKQVTMQVDGRGRRYFRGRDGGYPVVWDVVEIPPGQRRTVEVGYDVQSLGLTTDDPTLAMTLLPQPSQTPANYSIKVCGPSGYKLRSSLGDIDDKVLVFHGSMRTEVTFDAQILRS